MEKKSSKRWMIYVGVALVIILAAGFVVRRRMLAQQAATNPSNYQTEPAALGDLTATIGATGTVRSKQSAVLAWQITGKVATVSVSVGGKVDTNAVLAQLDSASLSPNVILAQAQLASDKKALDDLMNSQTPTAQAAQDLQKAQNALNDYQVNFQTTQAQYQLALANAQHALTSAQYNRNALDTAHGSQADIDTAQAKVLALSNQIDNAQKAFDRVSSRDVTDLVRAQALANLENLQADYTTAQANLNYLKGNATPDEIAQSDAALAQAQATLATAQSNWDQVKNGPNTVDQSMLQATVADAQRAYDRVKNGPNADDIAAAQARVASDEATINQSKLVAPFAGTITGVSSLVGDLVTPGTAAFQIDDLSSLYVDVAVSEVDIENVQVGQQVSLTFDAIQNEGFHGTISQISPVGTTVSGAVNFTVTVEITDKSDQIKPGMTAAANIVVNQLKNVLLVPNRAIRTQNGQRVVYVLENGVATPVQITLGALSDTQSEVAGGNLKAGDLIILNPPDTTTPNGGGGGLFGG